MAKFVNIKDIAIGDTIKVVFYTEENEDTKTVHSQILTVTSINLAEKSVSTLDGSTIYGSYAHNEYFNLN